MAGLYIHEGLYHGYKGHLDCRCVPSLRRDEGLSWPSTMKDWYVYEFAWTYRATHQSILNARIGDSKDLAGEGVRRFTICTLQRACLSAGDCLRLGKRIVALA